MSEGTPLDFTELIGELRELVGRVVALQIRDANKNLIARAEGEFGHLEESTPGCWSFQLGGDPPPEVEGVRFIVASWISVEIDAQRIREIHDISTGIGAAFDLRIRMNDASTLTLWPAMPLDEQWTDLHEQNR